MNSGVCGRYGAVVVALVLMCGVVAEAAESGGDASALYTQEGTDQSWAEVLASEGVTAGKSQSPGPVMGSRIHVNHALLEAQVGPLGAIPERISIHTEAASGIGRRDFSNWTRWYQEDGNVQVFRLFEGEQNVRGGEGPKGSQGRIESFVRMMKAGPDEWREWEGTYTIIKPLGANIFQLFHGGKHPNGGAILWPFHIRMTGDGDIYFHRRRPVDGLPREVVLAENMTGKSLRIKVRANGKDYEVYKKDPLAEEWTLVTTGSYVEAEDRQVSFRWGMYVGSKKGKHVPNDGMLFVTNVAIR